MQEITVFAVVYCSNSFTLLFHTSPHRTGSTTTVNTLKSFSIMLFVGWAIFFSFFFCSRKQAFNKQTTNDDCRVIFSCHKRKKIISECGNSCSLRFFINNFPSLYLLISLLFFWRMLFSFLSLSMSGGRRKKKIFTNWHRE